MHGLLLTITLSLLANEVEAETSVTVDPAVLKQIEAITESFNKGDAATMVKAFRADGEMIDDQGTIYAGREEIASLASAFFKKFPGAKLTLNVESFRLIGSALAIEEGTRSITTADGESRADLRYLTIWMKSGEAWEIASLREIAEDAPPTPHDRLEPLEWLIGKWVNEGDDAVVEIEYRWSDDGNYILADYNIRANGKQARTSTQRIGWDPNDQRIRSWLFDTDGGFAHAKWTPTENGFLLQSSAVLPSGETGSAVLEFVRDGVGRFTIKGMHRWIAGEQDENFEVTVVKRPPSAGDTAPSAKEANR